MPPRARPPAGSAPDPSILRDALFASDLQGGQPLTALEVQAAITDTLLVLSTGQCAGYVAQEFGDHPEAAVTRMQWVIGAVASAYRDALADRTAEPRPADGAASGPRSYRRAGHGLVAT